ncbi:hypothetical protein EDC54_103383 [Samsonia erythrinae]|uniref:Uncharacterized protein n=1 Tax=Samsonia erythrinae TaxID=160434 RepID=A0A4R3VLF5_9GAMM|nr:hypothetical protein EDC54_103383 [Samsonia erythrinae]
MPDKLLFSQIRIVPELSEAVAKLLQLSEANNFSLGIRF